MRELARRFAGTLSRARRAAGPPALCALLLGGSLAGCGVGEATATPPPPADLSVLLNRVPVDAFAEPRGNVYSRILLVTLDTLRADHVGAWGYPLATSPFLDSVAAEGVRFANAYSPMATTAPSHASMLTGLYPLQHRVTRNGHRLSPEVLTLAEILSRAGYQTAAVVSTDRHFGAAGIAQGFAHVDEPGAAEQRAHGDDGRAVDLSFRPAERTLDHALAWLTAHQAEPRQFLWIHLFDVHGVYVRRTEHERALGLDDPAVERRFHEFVAERSGVDLADASAASHYRDYDSALHYVDASLRSFFERGAAFGLDDFLVVIVADHGDALGERGWWGHGRQIYDEQIRVPMIVRWPDRRYQGTVDSIVELTDLMPTILWAAGIGPDRLEGRTMPLEGMPLQFLLEGPDRSAYFSHAFAQRRSFAQRSWFGRLLAAVRDENFETGDRFALIDRRGKYILQTALDDEYYAFEPGAAHERDNVLTEDPEHAHELLGSLLAVRSELEKMGALLDEGTVDTETIEKLRALGYVQ
jgi:arylsulfatase